METEKTKKNPKVIDFYNGMTVEQYETSILKWARLKGLKAHVGFAIDDERFDDVQKLLDQYKVDPSVFF